MTQWIKRRECL